MIPYRLQPIIDIADHCFRKGVEVAVLSPGSRVAPLTLGFARHSSIQKFTIPDERAAAYIALGMAQASVKPVALACTSGTAVLNYGPALAEAFYLQLPLLFFTADRPAEWTDQQDGQTIRQQGVHALHCKASYQLPSDYEAPDSKWAITRMVSEAIDLATAYPQGPVHVNVPIREPFYPAPDALLPQQMQGVFSQEMRGESILSATQWEQLAAAWGSFPKKMIVAGQQNESSALLSHLNTLNLPVLAEPIANLHQAKHAICLHDSLLLGLEEAEKEALSPDLLITFGLSIVSKGLKQLLRKYPPKAHWHIQPAGQAADAFQSLTTIIRLQPVSFFEEAAKRFPPASNAYWAQWEEGEERTLARQEAFLPLQPFGEMKAVGQLLKALPENTSLHLSNSMPVRLASFAGIPKKASVRVFANRGTSGIDGCSSTAVGHALAQPHRLHVLITGDMAFFYDRNAFWHNFPLPNLRILLINNHGGGIFRMIDGPKGLPEEDQYFVTHQALSAENTARDFNFGYQKCTDGADYTQALPWLLGPSPAPRLLELLTDSRKDQQTLEAYKKWVSTSNPFQY